jgi:hypothetical protein
MRLASAIFCIVVTLAVAAVAQRQTDDSAMQIGGIDVRLGAPQAATLKRFADIYDLRHADEMAGDNWFVLRRSGGPPYEAVGNLAFKDQKLTFASKAWTKNQTTTATDFAHAAYNALASASQTQQPCTIAVQDYNLFRSARIKCGRRELTINAATGESYASGVSETIH